MAARSLVELVGPHFLGDHQMHIKQTMPEDANLQLTLTELTDCFDDAQVR